MIEAGNRAKDTQRQLDREVASRAVAALLGPEVARPFAERPRRTGTVVGLAPGRIHVVLDAPPIDVRVPLAEQGKLEGGAWLTSVEDGARLTRKDGSTVCRLGDEVQVVAVGADAVVIDVVVKPLPELHDELIDAASAALRAWLPRYRQEHPGPLDEEALVTDAAGTTLAPAASTLADREARQLAAGKGQLERVRWAVDGWAHDDDAHEFDAVAALVVAQARAHADRSDEFVAMLHEAMMTALEDADTHGLFDGEHCAQFITARDGADAAAVERTSALRLNHQDEAEDLLAYLG